MLGGVGQLQRRGVYAVPKVQSAPVKFDINEQYEQYAETKTHFKVMALSHLRNLLKYYSPSPLCATLQIKCESVEC